MSLIFRAAGAYFILLMSVRLMGRRTASQMAPMDLVMLFLFGGVSITAVLGEDHSMVGAFTGIGTIGLMHVAVSWMKNHSDWFGRLVDGTPVVIYERGHFHDRRMQGLRIQKQDVMTAARQSGLKQLRQVAYAVVERDGKVSIIPQDDA